MPRSQLYIPDEVVSDIKKFVSERLAEIPDTWESASESEDSFTGDFGRLISERSRKVLVPQGEFPGVWTWSLRYKKLRGLGPKATEKALGADGILEVVVNGRGRSDVKSLLFQSKFGDRKDPRLVEQCAVLSNWREASAVFVYQPDAVRVVSIDSALAARGDIGDAPADRFDDFIANKFLKCLVGDTDLRYIPNTRTLVWRDLDKNRVSVKFAVRHRLRARITPPGRDPFMIDYGQEIPRENILKHRMYAEPSEVLTPQHVDNVPSYKEAKKKLILAYHPDRFINLSELAKEAVNARTREINEAWDYLKKHPR